MLNVAKLLSCEKYLLSKWGFPFACEIPFTSEIPFAPEFSFAP